MKKDLLSYLDNTRMPWGVLFYKIVWHQIGDISNLNIIDFGSGLGITADHFAHKNNVIAIEPNNSMVDLRECTNRFTQEIGGLEQLYKIEENSVDYIMCHNVLEYADDRINIMKEFERILKFDGKLSIVKHNHLGRIMQKVVFENNVDEAIKVLDEDDVEVISFGKVNYYENEELTTWSKGLTLQNYYGVRTFFALQQDNEVKKEKIWQEKMFLIENRVCNIPQFRDISFYHHLILKKQ